MLTITPVTPEAAERLRAFAEHTFRAAWEHMNDPADFEAYCLENFALAKVVGEMNAPQARFFFAEDNGELLAYLKLNNHTTPDEWPETESAIQIERIYVAPGQQGKGIGKILLDFTEKEAIRAGLPWVWLSVWQEAPHSIAFYEQNGYHIFGTEIFVVGNDPQVDWVMKKRVISFAGTPEIPLL